MEVKTHVVEDTYTTATTISPPVATAPMCTTALLPPPSYLSNCDTARLPLGSGNPPLLATNTNHHPGPR